MRTVVAVERCRPGDVLVVATTSASTDGMFGELFATSGPSASSWTAGPARGPRPR
jgi:regulator of RNase E activity RraA